MTTTQEKQIRIAAFCGLNVTICAAHHKRGCCGGDGVPDYFNSLEACHKMEESLKTDDHWQAYGDWLQEITKFFCVGVVPSYPRHLQSLARIAHATAKQRAEAFGKTFNLW